MDGINAKGEHIAKKFMLRKRTIKAFYKEARKLKISRSEYLRKAILYSLDKYKSENLFIYFKEKDL